MRWLRYMWFSLFIIVIPVSAQETCVAEIMRAFARSGAACQDVERNNACHGNGTVTGVFDARHDGAFSLVGERASTQLMQQLILSSDEDFSVAMLQLQLSLIDTQIGRNVSLVAFGDVTLTNQVPVRPTILIESTGVMTIRTLPERDAEIIGQYPLRTTVTANGLYTQGGWVRVQVPDTSSVGWVSTEIITATDPFDTLNLVDVDTPFLRSFQLMQIETARDDALCDGAPESGILLQAPNVIEAVELTINGVDLRVSGTVFIQSADSDAIVIRQIDGQSLVRVGSQSAWVVAGSEIIPSVTMTTASPFSEELASLPLNILNYRVRLPDVPSQAEIDAQVTALRTDPLIVAESSIMNAQRCIRTVRSESPLYAGPGTFYEVIRNVSAGSRLNPVLRLLDSEGVTWWQLSNGHWLLASRANSDGNCGEIPITQVVDAPTSNQLILETCDTTNGPIRSGQWVTIEFTHGSWRTLSEALNATRIDRGRITVNQQWIWVTADHPREVSEDRFYRVFTGSWYAEAGTYRITGGRLTYSVICDITVPVG